MPIRKLRADAIFDGFYMRDNHVLTLNESGEVISLKMESGETDVEYYEGILSPGFINCHCHTELSHLHGVIPQKTGLVQFVGRVMDERFNYKDRKKAQITAAINSMVSEGIVAVGDICNTVDSIDAKSESALIFKNFVEVSGLVPETASQRFEAGSSILENFLRQLPMHPAVIVPHAPYSVSKALLKMIAEAAKGQTITIHNQESVEENNLFLTGESEFQNLYEKLGLRINFQPTGTSSFVYWFPFFRDNKVIAVHNSEISDADLSVYDSQANKNLYFCLCPNANLYIEGKLPDLSLLINHGVPIVLGTDSLASNNRLSIMAEINTLMKNFPFLNLETCLPWATNNGATALGFGNTLGSFEVGKTPGVVKIICREGEYYAERINTI